MHIDFLLYPTECNLSFQAQGPSRSACMSATCDLVQARTRIHVSTESVNHWLGH